MVLAVDKQNRRRHLIAALIMSWVVASLAGWLAGAVLPFPLWAKLLVCMAIGAAIGFWTGRLMARIDRVSRGDYGSTPR